MPKCWYAVRAKMQLRSTLPPHSVCIAEFRVLPVECRILPPEWRGSLFRYNPLTTAAVRRLVIQIESSCRHVTGRHRLMNGASSTGAGATDARCRLLVPTESRQRCTPTRRTRVDCLPPRRPPRQPFWCHPILSASLRLPESGSSGPVLIPRRCRLTNDPVGDKRFSAVLLPPPVPPQRGPNRIARPLPPPRPPLRTGTPPPPPPPPPLPPPSSLSTARSRPSGTTPLVTKSSALRRTARCPVRRRFTIAVHHSSDAALTQTPPPSAARRHQAVMRVDECQRAVG